MSSRRRAAVVLAALVLPLAVALVSQAVVERVDPPRVPQEVRVGVSYTPVSPTPTTPTVNLPPPPPVGDDDDDDDD
ncbi:hypothetical protein [Longimycelium tulufanense]|nr:hypothetical protein [Longimycelium tulufanense]